MLELGDDMIGFLGVRSREDDCAATIIHFTYQSPHDRPTWSEFVLVEPDLQSSAVLQPTNDSPRKIDVLMAVAEKGVIVAFAECARGIHGGRTHENQAD